MPMGFVGKLGPVVGVIVNAAVFVGVVAALVTR